MTPFWQRVLELAVLHLVSFLLSASCLGVIAYLLRNILTAWIARFFLKQNTEIVESVRAKFANQLADYQHDLGKKLDDHRQELSHKVQDQVELLKASLSKKNISYQIAHTEYVKRQFIHVEDLYAVMYEQHKQVIPEFTSKIQIEKSELEQKKERIYEKWREINSKLFKVAFFLTDPALQSVNKYLQDLNTLLEIYEAYWDAANDLKELSLNEEERQLSVQSSQIERKNYETARKDIRNQFSEVTNQLKLIMAATVDPLD